MLAFIRGKIVSIDFLSVLVVSEAGIGYEIFINELVYAKIHSLDTVELYLHHQISENAQSLFGFVNLEERKIFRELVKISGIGGKVALSLLSLGSKRLSEAIQNEDKKTIESIKGVGKKMAEKIILELRDKDFVSCVLREVTEISPASRTLPSEIRQEILSTLTMMGYQSKKVMEMFDTLPEGLESLDTILPYIIKNY